MKDPRDSSAESEDLLVTLSSQQCSSTLSYATDSEMTDFEEDSNDDLTSVESDRDVPNFIGNDLLQDSRNNTKILTLHMSANASVSAF
jgi:hypothetical protein